MTLSYLVLCQNETISFTCINIKMLSRADKTSNRKKGPEVFLIELGHRTEKRKKRSAR